MTQTRSTRTLVLPLLFATTSLLLASPGAAQALSRQPAMLELQLDDGLSALALTTLAAPGVDLGLDPNPPPRQLRWLDADDPSGITQRDENRVHRGRILLGTGVPMLAMSSVLLAVGAVGVRGDGCYASGDSMAPSLGAGVVMAVVGAGFTFGGTGALATATPEARKARKSRKSRAILAVSATAATLLSTGLATGIAVGNAIGCYSS